jgi:hypothetical protein
MGNNSISSKSKKSKKKKTLRHSTQTDGIKWKILSETKFSEVFRDNQDCVPEWLANFEYEFSKRGMDLVDSGHEYQLKFEALVVNLKDRNVEAATPKMNDGTVQKYLTDCQFEMLTLLKRQILEERNHPIAAICNLFREEFGKAYKKYVKPKKNEKGVEDKVNIINMFRTKTKELQFIRKS